jgi:phosphate transport system permease protein
MVMEFFRRLIPGSSGWKYQSRQDRMFSVVGFLCTMVGIVTLCALLLNLAYNGLGRIDWEFLTSYPSRHAERAGILPAIVGSILIMAVTLFTAVPLGVAAAVYLEEYGRKNWLTTLIEINIANLAGVPSIIYSLMALGLLVYYAGLGQSILTGGLTLAFLVLPIVIVATREALRTIPKEIREAAFALGSTKWQVIWHHLLPYSMGGIATGVIIAMSRAIGETAPLITIGALAFIAFLPPSPVQPDFPFVNGEWLKSPFTVLPIQMFNWVSRPDPAFHRNAAATGLVLIAMTLSMNAAALVVRHRSRRRVRW